jgi:hypothetical protein
MSVVRGQTGPSYHSIMEGKKPMENPGARNPRRGSASSNYNIGKSQPRLQCGLFLQDPRNARAARFCGGAGDRHVLGADLNLMSTLIGPRHTSDFLEGANANFQDSKAGVGVGSICLATRRKLRLWVALLYFANSARQPGPRCAAPCQSRSRGTWPSSRYPCPWQAAFAPSARSRCLSSAGRASRPGPRRA